MSDLLAELLTDTLTDSGNTDACISELYTALIWHAVVAMANEVS